MNFFSLFSAQGECNQKERGGGKPVHLVSISELPELIELGAHVLSLINTVLY